MEKSKFTQQQLVFGFLYDNKDRWIKPWEFMGVKYLAGERQFLSYKAATRLSEIFKEAPCCVKRKKIKGKSGERYFVYRFFDSGLVYEFLSSKYFAIMSAIDEHKSPSKGNYKFNKLFKK